MKLGLPPGLTPQLARLLLGHMGLHSAMAGTRMAVPLLALSMGLGTAVIGFLLAAFALSQVLLALPAGRYMDRHGVRRPLIICALTGSLGIGVTVVWQSLPGLCIGALCSGGAVGVSVIALQRHVARMVPEPEQLRHVYSWLSVAPSVSLFIGPVVTGLVIDQFGFRAAFGALALVPLGLLVAARKLREAPLDPAPPNDTGSAWSLWRHPPFRRLLLLNLLMTASWDLHAFMVPVLAHERGHSASVIGLLLGAFAIAATVSRLAVPALARYLDEWVQIAVAVTLASLLFAVYPRLAWMPLMLASSFALGALLGSVQPSVMMLLHQVTPIERHGDALGMRLMMVNASAIVMPVLFGAAGGLISVGGVFYLTAGLVGASGGVALASARRKPP